MDIAALSTAMSQANVGQQVDIALTKDILENAEVQTSKLLQMMEQSVNPELGSNVDVKV